jgi:DNA-binding NarL/FixJ family response regulator
LTESLRVVLCDDHAVVRAGLYRILEDASEITVVGEADNADDAVTVVEREKPDIVVMDVGLPGETGISATQRIMQTCPGTRVLMLTMHDDVAYLRESFAAGAVGYVLKNAADVELILAVRQVSEGRRYVHPALGAALLAEQPEVPPPTRAVPKLSARETEILQHLAQGYTNPEMADSLHLSIRTIETYRASLQQKLGLRSRAELVRFARESGVVA